MERLAYRPVKSWLAASLAILFFKQGLAVLAAILGIMVFRILPHWLAVLGIIVCGAAIFIIVIWTSLRVFHIFYIFRKSLSADDEFLKYCDGNEQLEIRWHQIVSLTIHHDARQLGENYTWLCVCASEGSFSFNLASLADSEHDALRQLIDRKIKPVYKLGPPPFI